MGKTKKNEENDSESEYLCKYLLIEIFLLSYHPFNYCKYTITSKTL